MPRQRILTAAEQYAWDHPPVFTPAQRKKFFALSEAVRSLADTLHTPTNRVCLLVTLAYFRATRKFFTRQFHASDVSYAARLLGIAETDIDVKRYAKSRARHHQTLVLEYTGWTAFDDRARRGLTTHLGPLVRSQARSKVLLLQAIGFLEQHQIEIPSVYTLTELILDAVRRHKHELVEQVRTALPPASRRALDALFEKDPAAADDLHVQRTRLTLLKRFAHSTRPSKIKENLADLQTIRELYQPVHAIIRSLDLTPDGLRYYAHAVIKAEVFQVSRRADPERHLHLLCFIAHQYFHLHDLLMDVLLTAVQSARSTCQREHQSQYYEERVERRQTVQSLVENVEQAVCHPLAEIEMIAFQEQLPAEEKVRLIQDVLRQRGEERQSLQGRLTRFKDDLHDECAERGYYAVLEGRSVKLQNKVAGILQQVPFQGHEAPLLEAVRYYQAKKGNITSAAPTAFLNDEEKRLLTGEKGKFRTSLYKALLFLTVADAVKSGTLHVEESYRYRSLDDYLIPSDEWQRRRAEYLEQADLKGVADGRALLRELTAALDRQYAATNQHILEGTNEHITFHPDGSFHVRTPKEDEAAADTLGSFFPEDRYISLLEVLATVNRHSRFLDAFQHWQVKYAKRRPPERVLLAGVIGYGCQIGTGKVARISQQISGSELERTINWYFSRDNVAEANDKILALMDRLRLPQVYRRHEDRLHTSSDGQKVEVGVDSLNANYSFKYFGQGKGASAYTFIDERHFLFHSTVISSSEREAAYVIDGLMHNDVVQSDLHSTDTHGYTEILFGVMRLLGFSYAPRIKNFPHQQRYGFRRRKEYEHEGYRILPDGSIDTSLIEAQWDEILRFATTIKRRLTSASQLFKRLNSYSRQHPLYSALKEFGKIDKSLFLLKWIDLVELRQAVEKQLNKGESANRFADAVCFSRSQEFRSAEKAEQEMADGCNRLIRNAIICWNYLYLSQVLAEEADEERRQALLTALKNGSIVLWHHLNLHGEYDFSEEKLQDSVGFDLPKILAVDVLP
jgi:TnpA family transposase